MYMQVIHIALASAGTNEPIDYVTFAYWKSVNWRMEVRYLAYGANKSPSYAEVLIH